MGQLYAQFFPGFTWLGIGQPIVECVFSESLLNLFAWSCLLTQVAYVGHVILVLQCYAWLMHRDDFSAL